MTSQEETILRHLIDKYGSQGVIDEVVNICYDLATVYNMFHQCVAELERDLADEPSPSSFKNTKAS